MIQIVWKPYWNIFFSLLTARLAVLFVGSRTSAYWKSAQIQDKSTFSTYLTEIILGVLIFFLVHFSIYLPFCFIFSVHVCPAEGTGRCSDLRAASLQPGSNKELAGTSTGYTFLPNLVYSTIFLLILPKKKMQKVLR